MNIGCFSLGAGGSATTDLWLTTRLDTACSERPAMNLAIELAVLLCIFSLLLTNSIYFFVGEVSTCWRNDLAALLRWLNTATTVSEQFCGH